MNKKSLILLIGSNVGDSEHMLARAREAIAAGIGTVLSLSSLYRTAAWGKTDQHDFLNQAVLVQTNYSAVECLHKALRIEQDLGRIRAERWGPRIIDIDLIDFDGELHQTADLILPHPFIQDRLFTLVPMAEIVPDWKHPLLGQTIQQLLQHCPDHSSVEKL